MKNLFPITLAIMAVAGLDLAAAAAINNSHSNIKNLSASVEDSGSPGTQDHAINTKGTGTAGREMGGGCQAKCREDNQGNPDALAACLRECGAGRPGPASGRKHPGGAWQGENSLREHTAAVEIKGRPAHGESAASYATPPPRDAASGQASGKFEYPILPVDTVRLTPIDPGPDPTLEIKK